MWKRLGPRETGKSRTRDGPPSRGQRRWKQRYKPPRWNSPSISASDYVSLTFSSSSFYDYVRLTFSSSSVSDWLLDFRLASYCFQFYYRLVVWKIVKTSDLGLVQIGTDRLLRFQIGLSDFRFDSDLFQIHFRLLSEKNSKIFRFHIGSYWFILAWEIIAVDVCRIISLVKMPRKCRLIFL